MDKVIIKTLAISFAIIYSSLYINNNLVHSVIIDDDSQQ